MGIIIVFWKTVWQLNSKVSMRIFSPPPPASAPLSKVQDGWKGKKVEKKGRKESWGEKLLIDCLDRSFWQLPRRNSLVERVFSSIIIVITVVFRNRTDRFSWTLSKCHQEGFLGIRQHVSRRVVLSQIFLIKVVWWPFYPRFKAV